MGSLEGKTALVTGAASGIGRATALILAAEGAQVGVADILEEVKAVSEEIGKMGKRSTYATFDVADESAVNNGLNLIKKGLGPIDILVNNAGIYTNVKEVRKMPKENWDREIAINLTGSFLCIKAVLNDMIEKKYGAIMFRLLTFFIRWILEALVVRRQGHIKVKSKYSTNPPRSPFGKEGLGGFQEVISKYN